MTQTPELTICSVYYSSSDKELLELNWELVRKLNPVQNWTWLVADNSPPSLEEKIDARKFEVVPGARQDEVPAFARPWMRGSYHHTMGIQRSIPFIRTRFALFLDSDFYIVRPEWVDEIVSHMKKNGLAFFGVPWHPRHIKKYRYFPAVHSLFVDLEKADKNYLNFIPQYEELLTPSLRTKFVRKAKQASFRCMSPDRRSIGTSHDSGYDIFRTFHAKPGIRFECPKPVFKPERDLREYPAARSKIGGAFERFLPDRFCFVPKHKGYYSEVGFAERGFFDAAGQGWEEFVWKDSPFGFHMRGAERRGTSDPAAPLIERMIRSEALFKA